MEEDARIIWDPFLREKCKFSDWARYYGKDSAEKMWEKQERMREQHKKKKEQLKLKNQDSKIITFKPNENPHKQHPIDSQFLPLEYDRFFENESLLKALANKTMLFLVLLKDKVDWDKNEKLNLYQDYFIKRKLIVASISKVRLARMFGVDKRTIRNWLKQLQDDGLIEIEGISCDEDDDKRHKYNVFILGNVMEDGSYEYLYEKNRGKNL